MLKELMLTAKTSPNLLVREIIRRTLGISYRFEGIEVRDALTFSLLLHAKSRGYRVWFERGRFFISLEWGILSASSPRLLMNVLWWNYDDLYGVFDYRNMTVLDVGGYIGDTALWFLSRGASFVYVYEPVFYQEAEFNLHGKPAQVYRYGIWWDRRRLKLEAEGAGTGLHCSESGIEIETVPLIEVLENHDPDIVKMNCEGCEYSLLYLNCDYIKDRVWIIEAHGAESVIVEKLRDCGLAPFIIKRLAPFLSFIYVKNN